MTDQKVVKLLPDGEVVELLPDRKVVKLLPGWRVVKPLRARNVVKLLVKDAGTQQTIKRPGRGRQQHSTRLLVRLIPIGNNKRPKIL